MSLYYLYDQKKEMPSWPPPLKGEFLVLFSKSSWRKTPKLSLILSCCRKQDESQPHRRKPQFPHLRHMGKSVQERAVQLRWDWTIYRKGLA